MPQTLGAAHSIPPTGAPATETSETGVLEALSRLAGGVAHDLNNILLVVQGYTEMALGEEGVGPEVRELITEAKDATTRAAVLVRELLVAGQRGPFSPRLIDLGEAVRRQMPALRAACGGAVRITSSLAEGLPPVLLDEDLLGMLLTAICGHARDALPAGGGEVRIEVARAAAESDHVFLRVRDTRTVLTEEARGRPFEPYLPGREGGKGPGLAPLIVHAVARRHGGDAVIEGSDGDGTTFTVTLPGHPAGTVARAAETPAAEKAEGGVPAAAAEPPYAHGGWPPAAAPAPEHSPRSVPFITRKATILVAEDDEGLRALAAKILTWEGYAVITARDGQEAVEIFERDGGTISLVLLDDVMPRMGGRASLERIRRAAPRLPAIICSGYTWRLDGAPRECDAQCSVLTKPWQPRELLHRVNEALRTDR